MFGNIPGGFMASFFHLSALLLSVLQDMWSLWVAGYTGFGDALTDSFSGFFL